MSCQDWPSGVVPGEAHDGASDVDFRDVRGILKGYELRDHRTPAAGATQRLLDAVVVWGEWYYACDPDAPDEYPDMARLCAAMRDYVDARRAA